MYNYSGPALSLFINIYKRFFRFLIRDGETLFLGTSVFLLRQENGNDFRNQDRESVLFNDVVNL